MADKAKKVMVVKWLKSDDETSSDKGAKLVSTGEVLRFHFADVHESWLEFLTMYGVTQHCADQYAGLSAEDEKWAKVREMKSYYNQPKSVWDSRPKAEREKLDISKLETDELEMYKKLLLKMKGKAE